MAVEARNFEVWEEKIDALWAVVRVWACTRVDRVDQRVWTWERKDFLMIWTCQKRDVQVTLSGRALGNIGSQDGGFLKWGTPKSSKSWVTIFVLTHIETHGDLGIPHFRNSPYELIWLKQQIWETAVMELGSPDLRHCPNLKQSEDVHEKMGIYMIIYVIWNKQPSGLNMQRKMFNQPLLDSIFHPVHINIATGFLDVHATAACRVGPPAVPRNQLLDLFLQNVAHFSMDRKINRGMPENRDLTWTGWWYTYPSEKYESQLGWLFPIYGKIKFMFQTTNQWIHHSNCTRFLSKYPWDHFAESWKDETPKGAVFCKVLCLAKIFHLLNK